MTAAAGERSIYIDDYTDEVTPCMPTLDGWAKWLGTPEGEDDAWPHDVPDDGQIFAASAILWLPDIVATKTAEGWELSEQPDDDDFVAVRFCEGSGWDAESIVDQDGRWDEATSKWVKTGTLGEAIVKALTEDLAEHAEVGDTEFIARGRNEDGWQVTFHAGPPPSCTMERQQ